MLKMIMIYSYYSRCTRPSTGDGNTVGAALRCSAKEYVGGLRLAAELCLKGKY